MSSVQNPFAKIAEQGQEAVNSAVRTWADAVQRLSGQSAPSAPDLTAVVDNAFELAERLLATQHEFTTSVLRALATSTGNVTDAAADSLNRVAEHGADASAASAGTAAQGARRTAEASKSAADAAKGAHS